MTALDAALGYVSRGWPVFPCRWEGPGRKRPLTRNGFHDATDVDAQIETWWKQWPEALIGAPTGAAIGAVVLDIDVKDPLANGFDTLEDLGRAILPDTPIALTSSGGCHVYFACPERELKCSAGLLGPGLDVRAAGGYVILPGAGGYEWDPVWNLDTAPFAPAPDWLWPRRPSRPPLREPIRPVQGLSPYAEKAIESACNAIVRASPGEQEKILNSECFSIGTLAGAGGIPADLALDALLRAGHAMPDHDRNRPWRPEEIEAKVRRAFRAGQQQPREVRRAVA